MELATARSAESWEVLASDRFLPIRVESVESQFVGQLGTLGLGPALGIATVDCGASAMTRSGNQIAASDDRSFFISMQQFGPFSVEQDDRQARAANGDGVMYRANAPLALICESRTKCVSLRVSADSLESPARRLRSSTARSIPTSLPEYRLLRTFAEAAADIGGVEDRNRAARMSHVGLALVDALIGVLSDEESRGSDRLVLAERMRLFILDNLAHPALSPEAIATRFRVSSRYVSLVFEAAGLESPATLIRSRRIERAKHLLESEHLDLEEIARRAGFEGSTAFSRTFKRHTGVPPKEWRRLRAGEGYTDVVSMAGTSQRIDGAE